MALGRSLKAKNGDAFMPHRSPSLLKRAERFEAGEEGKIKRHPRVATFVAPLMR